MCFLRSVQSAHSVILCTTYGRSQALSSWVLCNVLSLCSAAHRVSQRRFGMDVLCSLVFADWRVDHGADVPYVHKDLIGS